MKAYRSRLMAVILAAMCCASPVHALAAEPTLTITSGLLTDQEETECTFRDSRVIYGEATPYADVSWSVEQTDAEGEAVEIAADSLTVGSLGLFSVTIPLEMGYNHITISLTEDGAAEPTVVLEAEVKRISADVKLQLQRMIALPGLPEKQG